MTTRLALLAMLASTGCLLQTTALVRGRPGGVEGGAVAVESVVSKVRYGVELSYERMPGADGERHGIAGFDYVMRGGLVAALLERRCKARPYPLHEEPSCIVEPWWFEVGPAAGVGLATTARVDLVAHAWFGAWADVRLWRSKAYPVLRIEVQTDAYSGEYRGAPQVSIGLGYAAREREDRW